MKGAPGIGLMAAKSCHIIPEARELLKLSADNIKNYELLETDTILCGNTGVALCLIEAAKALRDKSYLTRAGQLLKKMTERAAENNGFRVVPDKFTNSPDPSFMEGYAGIGYVILRYLRLCY